jgi:hypothetical protein
MIHLPKLSHYRKEVTNVGESLPFLEMGFISGRLSAIKDGKLSSQHVGPENELMPP